MINTVIFDIGGVLVRLDWEGFVRRLFPGRDELVSDLLETIWYGGRWDRLDAGDEPEEVLASMIAHSPEHEAEIRKVFANVGDTLMKRPETPAWIHSVKSRGCRALYLSNYSHYVMDLNPDVLDFLPLLDGGIFSCDIRAIKPERKIYAALAEKYNLNPSECVFIDDVARNVEGAKNFGYHAIQFVTLEQAQEDLNKLLQEER